MVDYFTKFSVAFGDITPEEEKWIEDTIASYSDYERQVEDYGGGFEWQLQKETAELLRSPIFTKTVDGWIFAAQESLAATAGVQMLRDWGIEPVAISGVIAMSPLGMREAREQTGLPCLTSGELKRGELNDRLARSVPRHVAAST